MAERAEETADLLCYIEFECGDVSDAVAGDPKARTLWQAARTAAEAIMVGDPARAPWRSAAPSSSVSTMRPWMMI